jgi:hypothetical protein
MAPNPDQHFPDPLYIGKQRRWRLSELINYERALAGLPPAECNPADEQYLTAAQVRTRYGNVSDMWLWRRTAPEAASAQ